MKFSLILFIILLTLKSYAQNLVPNAGFEANDFGQVRDWKQPIEDYYHYEVITEMRDSELVYNSVNGLCLLHPFPSEFLIAKLTKPLTKGKQYCARLKLYLGTSFIGKLQHLKTIDIAFSDTDIYVAKRRMLYNIPAVSIPLGNDSELIKEPEPVVFTANGTEQFIIIGKFHSREKVLTFEQKREQIWREQYYAADSINKYFKSLLPTLKPLYSKREIKKETKKLNDSLNKLEAKRIECIHANAAFYSQKVDELANNSKDTTQYHIRLYFDDICVAPLLADGRCECNKQTNKPFRVGQTYRLNNIQFDLDKSTFRHESYAAMDTLIQILKRYPKMEIQLNGHTDSLNSEQYNLDLSNKRAKAVYNYLVLKGIKAQRLKWKGYGESKPLTFNTTEEGREINRRVEFLILKNDD